MQSLTWYINRLGRMSAAEITHRVLQAGRAATDRLVDGTAVPEPGAPSASLVLAPGDSSLAPAAYVEQAQRVIAGRLSVFDLGERELGAPPQWNRDPLTGRVAPLTAASALDYRDERLVGNIKYLWEPNRHLHVPRLAQAYALTGEMRYASAVQQQIDSWIEQCPCGRGPNWTSSLELAIRLINWSLAWQWLGGWTSPLFEGPAGRAFRRRWLTSVYRQTRAITRKLSRFSSANNHLIGETAGVWIASVCWDYWPEMRIWGRRCKRILLEEALKQNAPDGCNREQAFSYQQFVLDFLLLAALAARAAGEDFPREFWRRLECMIEFVGSIRDVSGHMPMVGDADDGYVVDLSPEPGFDNYQSLLATGAVLFGRSDFAAKARRLDEKTRWLLGTAALDTFNGLLDRRGRFEPRREFPDSGYYLLGTSFEEPEEVRMLVDAGPLGYLSIAAHGHADALSVVLNVGGHEVLVDPGTYAYHTEPQWRAYFRSTRAHNTVLVDGQDQSVQSGNFMWSHHAQAHCAEFRADANAQRFVGEHDGYRRLADPVIHRREIDFDTASRTFTIVDTLRCAGAHDVCRLWHFAEGLNPRLDGGEIEIRVGGFLVRIVAGEQIQRGQVIHGGSASEGGWISRRFGHKSPTATAVWETPIRGTTQLRTCIHISKAEQRPGAAPP